MAIEITFRHITELGHGTREHAQALGEALMAEFPSIENIHVIVSKDGGLFFAEVGVQGGRGMNAEGKEKDADGCHAIGMAFKHAERQLRKHLEKLHEHRA